MQTQSTFPGPDATLVDAWKTGRTLLGDARLPSPILEARLLLQEAAGCTREDILTDPHRPLGEAASKRLSGFLERRLNREPISLIRGRVGFWKYEFRVSPDVLAPRADTEAVVEGALKTLPEDFDGTILDLGVGSGAILISLLKERPSASGVAVEASADALAVAKSNAAALGVADRITWVSGTFATADLTASGSPFDLIVTNPPYIAAWELPMLDPEVREHEPRIALDGGADGLDAYRAISERLAEWLKPGAQIFAEIGWTQAEAVHAYFDKSGVVTVDRVLPDLSGRPRVVVATRRSA